MSGADERELEEALQRSLKDYQDQNQQNRDDDDAEPAVGTVLNRGKKSEDDGGNKFQAFSGKGISLGQDRPSENMEDVDANLYAEYGDDPELAYAIKMSMLQQEQEALAVPDEPQDTDDQTQVLTLQFRLPSSLKLQRKFFYHNTISDLINYVSKQSSQPPNKIKILTTGFPKKTLDDTSKTLKEQGFGKQEALIVEFK